MPRTVPATAFLVLVFATGGVGYAHAQAATVTEIQIAPPNVSLNIGQRTSIFATAYNASNNVVVIQRITWFSSNPAVVRIEGDSTSPEVASLVGLSPGSAIIEARMGNKRGVATVQVSASGAALVTAGQMPPAPVVSTGAAVLLKVEPSSLFMLPSEGTRLVPTFLKDDGTPTTPVRLTWKSLLPSIATVDPDGGVVAISPGQGLIEATAGTLAARVPVSVTLSKISLTRRMQTMSPGTSDTFTVFVPEQNNRLLPSTAIQWRSTDESVARVSPFGVVTAVGGGHAEIVGSGFLQELRVPVNVHKRVEYLSVSPPARTDTVRIALGSSQRFVAEAQAQDGTPVPEAQMVWRLLDSSVASFDQSTGLLTPKRVGATRLRVSVVGGGLDTAWTIGVIAGGIRVGTHLAGLATGERLKVSASLIDDLGRPIAPATGVRWSTSAPAVAQVDGDGNVLAIGFGHAAIVAATPWGRGDTLSLIVQGELLVTSSRAGTPDLYALDRKAPSAFNRLTSLPTNEVGASYAPGGTVIAFVSSKDGNQELYVIDADGANPRRLTNTPAQEDSPEWTPDGKQIVFASNATGAYQIWIMNADGTDQRRLTDGPAFNFQPAVSPDGRTIAFTSTRDGTYDVYLMNIDGTNQRSLFKSPGKETIPQWFPDGQLAFLQEQRTGTGRNSPLTNVVVRRDATSGQLSNLTPLTLVVTDFAISAQGDLLALIVSSQGQGRSMSSRLYLQSTTTGAPPAEVPLQVTSEQVFAPAFRK